MIRYSVLEQRRATKRAMVKRLRRSNLQKVLNKLEELKQVFPYNTDYYIALAKGLIKLDRRAM